jgi:hypothetical protein
MHRIVTFSILGHKMEGLPRPKIVGVLVSNCWESVSRLVVNDSFIHNLILYY